MLFGPQGFVGAGGGRARGGRGGEGLVLAEGGARGVAGGEAVVVGGRRLEAGDLLVEVEGGGEFAGLLCEEAVPARGGVGAG